MIKLFGENDTTFASNGDLILNPTRAIVHKEDNGSFYLDLETNLNEEKRIVEAETGTTIDINENTQILDNDTSKEMKYELLGDTYQYTTTLGKNLFDCKTTAFSNSNVNISFSGNTITMTTNTTTNSGNLFFMTRIPDEYLTNGQSYTISSTNVSGVVQSLKLQLRNKDGTFVNGKNRLDTVVYDSTYSLYVDGNIYSTLNSDTIQSGTTAVISNIQVEKGASPTSYESFVPNSPSPDYPQPIEVVTGRQEIDVVGKNLYDYTKATSGKSVSASNGSLYNDTNSFATDYLIVKGLTSIVTNGKSNTNKTKIWGAFYDKDKIFLSGFDTNASYKSVPNNACYLRLGIINEFLNTLQVESGTSSTTYSPYIGQSYEVNLGKNLLDITNISSSLITPTSGWTLNNNTLQWSGTTGASTGFFNEIFLDLPSGTYTISGNYANNLNLSNMNDIKIRIRTSSNTHKSTGYTQTYDKSSGDKISLLFYKNMSNSSGVNTTITETFTNIQLEKGSQATSYSEYFTPIELCKISTYQDKIYKDNGKWYIYKEIGKHTFSGTFQGAGVTNVFYSTSITDYLTSNNIPYSNYFKGVSNVSGASGMSPEANNSVGFINKSGGVTPRFYIKSDEFNNNSSTLNTWLRTHNTDAYYALANPTTTEITSSNYPELLEQLNAFELLSGLNNITLTSSDLTPTMKLTYNYVTGGEVTTSYIDYLQPNRILVANTPQGEQAFRIGNVEKTRTKIRLKANHIFYDTNNYVIKDSYVVEKNCNDALDHLNNATDNPSPFITTSDINTIDSYRCVRSSLYEAIQVVLERWGGHLVRNNFNIGVMDSIGDDNGVVVRYGKNLKDINAQYNWDAVVTKLMPVGQDGLLLPEEWLYSSISYDIPYTKVVSFDQSNIVQEDYQVDGVLDEEAYNQALIDDLRQKGNQYLETNSVPMVNYTLDANLERISDVGDTIEVIDERLGINILTNLISFEYNCLLEKYIQVQFGNFTPKLESLIQTIENNTTNAINENNATMRVTLSNELEQATDRIWGVLGNSYVIYDGDKILVVDALPKEDANNVLMINAGGIGFSNTGIDGTFTSAWTIDNTLNMQNINVINLTADLIKGGTLKLGSNLNQYGELEIYDEANNLIAEMNKDGLKMYGEDGSYVVLNNQEGFAGYDRNDNKIYWADGEAFHMKKSEVEEEITLCGKMRYIPIQILDVNNNITNDGIGLVSVLGGGS